MGRIACAFDIPIPGCCKERSQATLRRLTLPIERFPWIACQLETLRSCLTRTALKKALTSLPKTLPDTYDRILTSTVEGHREAALRALQWLTYAVRPLTLYEVTDA